MSNKKFALAEYDLFLFDFDGLLVDTETLHFEAYRQMCLRQGCSLSWSFKDFISIAHADAVGIRKRLYEDFPNLNPNWEELYAQKKEIYQTLIEDGKVQLMPGVEEMLDLIEGKMCCVVTNSPKAQTEAIRKQLPPLNAIPHWFTREMYARPKPFPDGYLKAMEMLGSSHTKTIGFEDSMRGFEALKGAGVDLPILICDPGHPQLGPGLDFYSSFIEFQKSLHIGRDRSF